MSHGYVKLLRHIRQIRLGRYLCNPTLPALPNTLLLYTHTHSYTHTCNMRACATATHSSCGMSGSSAFAAPDAAHMRGRVSSAK